MTGSAIAYLSPIIKVLYNNDGSIKSFLTLNHNKSYTLYMKEKGHKYYYNKQFTQEELEEIKELFKSPIEKIDLDQLEKY